MVQLSHPYMSSRKVSTQRRSPCGMNVGSGGGMGRWPYAGQWAPQTEKNKIDLLLFRCCHARLFVTPWMAARQASLSITNSRSFLKLTSIKSVMPSNHLILYHPLLLLPSIFPSIRVFSNESVLHIRWPKYWSFSFNISPFSEHPGLVSFRMDWLDLLAVQGPL